MNKKVYVWQDIKDLDAQIRTMTPPDKKDNPFWTVEIGVQESLGERGGDILTYFYKGKPTIGEIRQDIVEHYKEEKMEINKPITAWGIIAKSGRDEIIEGAIDKVLAGI